MARRKTPGGVAIATSRRFFEHAILQPEYDCQKQASCSGGQPASRTAMSGFGRHFDGPELEIRRHLTYSRDLEPVGKLCVSESAVDFESGQGVTTKDWLQPIRGGATKSQIKIKAYSTSSNSKHALDQGRVQTALDSSCPLSRSFA